MHKCLQIWDGVLRSGLCFARQAVRASSSSGRLAGITRVTHHEPGLHYDLYTPRQGGRRTFILLHGLTMEGERDPRLVRLATCLAAAGLHIVVLRLPALTEFRIDPEDVRVIVRAVANLGQSGPPPVGLIGFSLGAGLGLVAAAEPETAGDIDSLFLCGTYYRLGDLQKHLQEFACSAPRTEEDWEAFIWLRLVLAYRQRHRIGLSEEGRRRLFGFLQRYCHGPSPGVKRRLYADILRELPIDWGEPFLDERLQESLSPANRMHRVDARIFLLHDAVDRLVPPTHASAMFDALCRHGKQDRCRILVSPLLSHISVAAPLTIAHAWRLGCMTANLFAL